MSDYGECDPSGNQPDFTKDPDSTVDFPFNWSAELNGDTIFTSEFLLPDGLTEVSSDNTTTTATIFVSGGDVGNTYRVTNRIVTIGGRTYDKTAYIAVREH